MPSSTSSSDIRPAIPDRDWARLAGQAALLAFFAVAAWEWRARVAGYVPFYNDTPEFWADQRDLVEPASHVFVGSSRLQFDVDTDLYAHALGVRPAQLAVVGSSPLPVLADLAADEAFRGVAVVGVTPGLFFAPGGPPVQKTKDWVVARGRRSPSGRFGQFLMQRLEEHVACLQLDDLSLRGMLKNLALPDRKGAIAPRLPPYIATVLADRSMRMAPRLETDPAFQAEIHGIWKGLFQAAPPMTKEQALAARDGLLAQVAADVARLRGRGGRVVFLRLPSTGWVRDFERATTPRAEYWDVLLARTGAPGVHFEDHPELAGWECPEWSHLRAGDVGPFTQALLPHLRRLLAASP